jgi:hypothetical protein
MIGAEIDAAPITATSQKIGSMIVREQGCERLISRVEAEIERAREAAGRATPGEIARREWEFFGGLAPVLEGAGARVEGKPLDKRLAKAFPHGIPSDVARFFAWESARAFSREEAEYLTDRHFSLRNPGQDIDAYMNLLVIRQLADVICGQAEPDDSLARDLALESAWDVYPEWKREAIASGRRKEAEREKARAAEFEKEWTEREAQIAEALAAEAAAIAEVNALDLKGLVFYTFNAYPPNAVKAVLAGWPARPTAHLCDLAINEIEALGWREKPDGTRDRAFDRAIARIKQIIRFGA